jgi:hypothetical protein
MFPLFHGGNTGSIPVGRANDQRGAFRSTLATRRWEIPMDVGADLSYLG